MLRSQEEEQDYINASFVKVGFVFLLYVLLHHGDFVIIYCECDAQVCRCMKTSMIAPQKLGLKYLHVSGFVRRCMYTWASPGRVRWVPRTHPPSETKQKTNKKQTKNVINNHYDLVINV